MSSALNYNKYPTSRKKKNYARNNYIRINMTHATPTQKTVSVRQLLMNEYLQYTHGNCENTIHNTRTSIIDI